MRHLTFLLLVSAAGPALAETTTPANAGPNVDMSIFDTTEGDELRAGSMAAILEPARFTLMHEVAPRINSPHRVTNNRSSFRVQYEKHFLDKFYLQLDSKLTAFWGKDHRAIAEGRDFHHEFSSRDAYVQFSTGNTSVRLGRQILIWGESDAGAITDVISPRNLSELFFISLEESRISQFMLNVEQFSPLGDWSAFYVPDAQYNEYPDRGTAYYMDPFAGQAEIRGEDKDLGEFGLRWKKTFGRSDIAFMAASLIDNDIPLRGDGFSDDGKLLLMKERQRFHMVGATFTHATGSTLFSGEIARKSPKAFTTGTLELVEKDVLDTSLRAQYSFSSTRSVSLELVNNHISSWTPDLGRTPRNRNALVFGWNDSFLHENLTLSLLSVYTQPYTSLQHSLFMSYKWNDRLTLGLDVFYLSVDSPYNDMYAYRKESHAVLKIFQQF